MDLNKKKERLWRIRIWLQLPKKLVSAKPPTKKGTFPEKLKAVDIYPACRLFRNKEFTVNFKRSGSSNKSNYMLECFIKGGEAQSTWESIEEKIESILNILSFTLQVPIRKVNFEALDLTLPHVLKGEREVIFGPKVPSIHKDTSFHVLGDKWKIGINPKLMVLELDERVDAALRWYSKASTAEPVVDQFAFYWIALESLSMPTKPREKVFFKCQACNHEIQKCPKCSHTTKHFPETKERLKELVVSKMKKPKTLFERLWNARNMMFHGRYKLAKDEVEELLNTVYELRLIAVEALKLRMGLSESEVPALIAPDSIHIAGEPILGGSTKLTKEHIKSFLRYKRSLKKP